jgi:DNA-binding SARP family transcriptional activator/CheY-like chemotaxis protein
VFTGNCIHERYRAEKGEQQMNNSVLVVEDRDDWQDILCTTLAQYNFVPHSVATYQAAVTALTDNTFELVVIDPVLDMANRFNRDGLSVMQSIREGQPELPIIVLTGSLTHDMEVTIERLYPGAPVLFKEKWDSRVFVELIEKLVHNQPIATATRDSSADVRDAPAPALPALPAPPASGPRVLLVENRLEWQEIVVNELARLGVFWRVAGNAQEAVDELNRERFHLVILDLKLQQEALPLRSNEGWLLLDYLVENHPKTKVVVLSGRAGPSDVADLLTQYPVVSFVEKQNFSSQAIAAAVNKLSQAPSLTIQTLGQFKIWRDGHVIGVWERPQAETVVKLLLIRRVRGERAMAVDELIARLWPEDDEQTGRKKLLPLISNARHTIEPDIEPRDSNFILRSANGYYFDIGETVTWDLLYFRESLNRGKQLAGEEKWVEAVSELEKGRALYKGDFLVEDRYADWAIDMRREITTEYCKLLMLLADTYAVERRYASAIEACEAALAKDPLVESVYRRMMRFHYCSGEKALALKAYRDCLKLFEELFGESPTPATRQLYQAITNNVQVACLE